jgi:hypothetical protein
MACAVRVERLISFYGRKEQIMILFWREMSGVDIAHSTVMKMRRVMPAWEHRIVMGNPNHGFCKSVEKLT